MPDYGQEMRFGVFIEPSAAQAADVVELAKLADRLELDYVTFQDHPYQARFLDTWTLLSVVAAQTTQIRVAPNVANLPLRDPFMLARAVASLDLLSDGRAELGLGAGAFWEAIEAVGGRRLSPGESVDALEEALGIIRQVWAGERSLRHQGEHYRLAGAHAGPSPAHPVEIWLGAYKPRMLALTGAKADGWVPSMGYAEPEALAAMNARIDEAAAGAGREPAAIRRMYNLMGEGKSGFLSGGPVEQAERLAELTLADGISTYLLSVSSDEALRAFAEEVAPAVRELVEAERSRVPAVVDVAPAVGQDGAAPEQSPATQTDPPPAQTASPGSEFSIAPTPPGERRSEEQPWDEAARPHGPAPDPERSYSSQELSTGRHLIDVHDALRAELGRLRDAVAEVAAGNSDPTALRSFFNRMTIRQNNWSLGAFCESYCRAVTVHHTIEDRSVFPHLRQAEPDLEGVLDRLGEEHETISALLDRIDDALVALVSSEPEAMARVEAAVDLISDAMDSHFSYEERELIEPLARLGFQ